ncbi:hypothetical protein [Nocardia brasiliensis]|uniref:hypothetical protein n=1 Tax=Nocardia brasiliensis TaxID=37326 RepID=UPI0036725621
MNNPWLQHILLIGAIHTVWLGVGKVCAATGKSGRVPYLESAGTWGEAFSYLVNGALMAAVAWAWVRGNTDVARVPFDDLAIPSILGPAVAFLTGLITGPDSPVGRWRER